MAYRDYPLAFISTEAGRTFSPIAVPGVTGGENLSLRDGRWDGAVYAIVSDYALLEPFTLQASLKSGPTSFGGMYRVDEKRLEFLNAA